MFEPIVGAPSCAAPLAKSSEDIGVQMTGPPQRSLLRQLVIRAGFHRMLHSPLPR